MERFYDDIIVSEEDTLRVGKILSPVGDWNLIHAAPLVPTTTRPLTTHNGFAEYANGIAWLHDPGPGAGPGWQIYLQPGREWLPRPNDIAPDRYRNVSGAHVSWSNGLSNKVGISFQQGETVNLDERYRLVGINARTSFGKLMLESEAKVSRWSGAAARARDKELGIYALADYAFTPRWHGVLEWEHYQGHHGNEPSRNTLVGVAYRPDPSMVWKFEYVHQTGDASEIPSGWLASFSVLFDCHWHYLFWACSLVRPHWRKRCW
jgi:hypothetical protein